MTTMRVRAIELGYTDLVRRRPGDVFEIHSPEEFSVRWMEPVGEIPAEWSQAIATAKSTQLSRNARLREMLGRRPQADAAKREREAAGQRSKELGAKQGQDNVGQVRK